MHNILQEAISISKSVGRFLYDERTKIQASEIEHKSGVNDLVSRADKEAEQRFVAVLEKLIPASGFIAEEGTTDKIGQVYNWIIDPLDGTTNYLYGIPCYCTSLALKKHNELVLGVIYDPTRDECFYAEANGGTFLNGEPIHVSEQKDLSKALIATGFPYDSIGRSEAYLKILGEINRHSRGIRRLGSAALDMAYVACGRFDAFYEYGLHPWDCAAGAVIIKEAGGIVTDFKNEAGFMENRTMMSDNGHLHEQLLPFVENW